MKKTIITTAIVSAICGMLGGALTIAIIWNSFVIKTEEENPIIVKQDVIERAYVEESAIIDSVKTVSPAVVSIVVTKDLPTYREINPFFNPFLNEPFLDDFFYRQNIQPPSSQRTEIGGGSGFIITNDGLILTNKHVVVDVDADYTVILSDGTEHAAKVVGRDALNDLAVLRVEHEEETPLNLPVVEFGDSESILVGQRVVAIGNALAEFQNTVTSGVVSAKGRQITASDGSGASSNLSGLIQTDAAINPGNSGGPLVNLKGQVIGVNTAVASSGQGIGFAIPINDVKTIIKSVKEHGRIIRPYIGVRYMMLNEEIATERELEISSGALIIGDETHGFFAVVPESPAEKAGLQIEDVILKINGENVTKDRDLRTIVNEHSVEDVLNLTVWRNGEEIEIQLTLEEADS